MVLFPSTISSIRFFFLFDLRDILLDISDFQQFFSTSFTPNPSFPLSSFQSLAMDEIMPSFQTLVWFFYIFFLKLYHDFEIYTLFICYLFLSTILLFFIIQLWSHIKPICKHDFDNLGFMYSPTRAFVTDWMQCTHCQQLGEPWEIFFFKTTIFLRQTKIIPRFVNR